MSAAIPLRDDFTASELRQVAKASRDAGQSRRLLALAEIDDGGSRTDAARIGAVGLQTVRDWVLAFNAQKPDGAQGPDGPIDDKAPGQAPKLSPEQRRALAAIVGRGPDPERDGVVRWRLKDPAAWIQASFGVSLDESSVGRVVEALGFRKLSARPRHFARDPAARTASKKTCPPN